MRSRRTNLITRSLLSLGALSVLMATPVLAASVASSAASAVSQASSTTPGMVVYHG
jgi:hypothetical protein